MQTAVQRVFDDYSLQLSDQNKIDIYFYPNPVENEVTFQLNSQISNTLTFTLYSALGQLVHSDTLLNSSTLNLAHLTKGVYYLHLFDGERAVVKKLIKK
jgi:hypothetical protein